MLNTYGTGSIGVIASDVERKLKLKWYEFWKKNKPEYFYIERYDVVLVIAYLSQNIEQIFKKEGVEKAILTKMASTEKLYQNIEVVNGRSLFKNLLPEIIKKLIKIAGIAKQNSTIAIIDKELNGDVEELIEKLYGDFRNIILVTDNEVEAKIIAETFLDEYGLTILITGIDSKVNCDIAVITGNGSAQLPKHTIVIDASFEYNKTNKNVTINWIELSKVVNLPFEFDSLELFEYMENVCGIDVPYKLSEFKFNEKVVSSSQLVKKK